MAVTLTDFGAYKLTNDATAGNATAVTFPTGTIGVLVTSTTSETRISDAGTDGQAIGNDYIDVAAGLAPAYIPLSETAFADPPVVYFAHGTNSGVTRLLPVRSDRSW